jgi:asparagine synthase (glutamine-hydrolysing)
MCGIAGILSLRGQRVAFSSIALMTGAMRHRGPDDEGLVFFGRNGDIACYGGQDTPESVYKGRLPYHPDQLYDGKYPDNAFLAFGHRRLSIIDLSPSGHQPMSTEDGRYWITYNGEVYNYLELKRELIKSGETFVSKSDTEVVLKAYRHWGPECLRHFNGMWAFAIWDTQDQKLFCSRDRIGIKPFYYIYNDRFFAFASDIKTLIASGLYEAEINYEGLWHNLSFSIAPRPMTCFDGVFSLEQSHWMLIDLRRGIVKKERYWSIPIGTQDKSMKESDAVELLESELTKAIRYQLIADVDVATFMSGGIDSTTLSAIASRLHPGIKSFTLGFDKSITELDEVNQAVATAQMNQMDHIIEIVYPNDIQEEISQMILCAEEPNAILPPNYVISKLISRHGIKVAMNGLGGDELFAGYRHYVFLHRWRLIRHLKNLLRIVPYGLSRKFDTAKKLSGCTDIGQYFAFWYSTLDEREKMKLFDSRHVYNSVDILNKFYNNDNNRFTDDSEALSYFDIMHYIGNHHVYRIDQFCMHFSIEGRFPYLDHKVIEAAFKIPTKYKIKEGMQKYVLRKVAQKYIHPSSLSMKKKGFGLPSEKWFNGELKSMGDESMNYVKGSGLFQSNDEVDKVLERNRNQFILLGLWHKAFFGKPKI